MVRQAISTDLVGAWVSYTIGGCPYNDGTVRAVFLDGDDKVKLLVQTEDGRMLDLFAETQVKVATDYRGVPMRARG